MVAPLLLHKALLEVVEVEIVMELFFQVGQLHNLVNQQQLTVHHWEVTAMDFQVVQVKIPPVTAQEVVVQAEQVLLIV